MFQVDAAPSPKPQPACDSGHGHLHELPIQASPAKKIKPQNSCYVQNNSGMSPCKSGVAAAGISVNEKNLVVTKHQLWANLLAIKMDRMHPRRAEDFMVKVDTMAGEHMELE